MFRQAVKKFFVARPGRGSLTHHHEIEPAERLFVRPEGFANDSLQAVALNGQTAVLLGDREAQSGALPAVLPRQHGEQLVAAPMRFFEDALIGISVEQTVLSSEPLGACVTLFWVIFCRNGGPRYARNATATAVRALSPGGVSG